MATPKRKTEDDQHLAARHALDEAIGLKQKIVERIGISKSALSELCKQITDIQNKVDALEKEAAKADRDAVQNIILSAMGEKSDSPVTSMSVAQLIDNSKNRIEQIQAARRELERQIRDMEYETKRLDGEIHDRESQVVATSPQFHELLEQYSRLQEAKEVISMLCDEFLDLRKLVDESEPSGDVVQEQYQTTCTKLLSEIDLKRPTMN